MNATLLRALWALLLVGLLAVALLVLFPRHRTFALALELCRTASLMLVVLTHVCEGTSSFPWMHWGQPHSAGHYLDLSAAVLAVASFAAGLLLQAIARG